MMKEKDLLKLKEEIDGAKIQVAELKGRRSGLMQELRDKWGCETVGQAQKKLKKMKSDIQTLNERIEEGIKAIEDEYDV